MHVIKASFQPHTRSTIRRLSWLLLLVWPISMAGLWPVVSEADAAPQVLQAAADSHVYAYAYRNWNKSNWGKQAVLAAGWHPTGGEKRAYIRFNLPRRGKVGKATLRLYVTGTYGKPGCRLAAFLVTTPWKEGTDTYHSGQVEKTAGPGEISWQQQPQVVGRSGREFTGGNQGAWATVDITDFVNQWLSGKPNYGVAIMPWGPKSGQSGCIFASREAGDPATRPQLVLEARAPGGAPPPPPQTRPGSPAKPQGQHRMASAVIDNNCGHKQGAIVVPPGMMAINIGPSHMYHGGLPCSGPEFPKAWGGCIRGAAGLYYWFETSKMPLKRRTLGDKGSLVLGPGAYTVCIWGGKPSYWHVDYTLVPGNGPFSRTIKGPWCCGRPSGPGR